MLQSATAVGERVKYQMAGQEKSTPGARPPPRPRVGLLAYLVTTRSRCRSTHEADAGHRFKRTQIQQVKLSWSFQCRIMNLMTRTGIYNTVAFELWFASVLSPLILSFYLMDFYRYRLVFIIVTVAYNLATVLCDYCFICSKTRRVFLFL